VKVRPGVDSLSAGKEFQSAISPILLRGATGLRDTTIRRNSRPLVRKAIEQRDYQTTAQALKK
jgi:hypothetical protein